MRRLVFATIAVLGAFYVQALAFAQHPGRVYRVAVLAPTPQALHSIGGAVFLELERLGFAKGRNLLSDEREGGGDQLPLLARSVVAHDPDALIVIGSDALAAAAEATNKIPIIVYGSDPILLGVADNLRHPGRNVTGRVIFGPELDGKRLQLLHEAVPHTKRVAALVHSAHRLKEASLREMSLYAVGSGVELLVFEVGTAEDYAAAFEGMQKAGAQGVVITAHPQFGRDASVLADLALSTQLPTSCEWRDMARRGCLLGYGPSRAELFRGVADYVARVLNGVAPSSLPIVRPTTFDLGLNLKTAKALGLTIPPTLLARADEIIE